MQIKIFTIPIPGGESLAEDMNLFLRSKKVLQVENHVVSSAQGAYWCFCIRYLDEQQSGGRERQRTDYRQVLDEAAFKRFSALREIRKQIALEEAIPAYSVLKDEELAEMAKPEELTPTAMRGIKGIGEKKMEKYGHRFIHSDPPSS